MKRLKGAESMVAKGKEHGMARRISLGLIGLLILALYVVPYLMIGHIAAWYGSFLFWLCAGLVIILLNIMATAGFGDNLEANAKGDGQ